LADQEWIGLVIFRNVEHQAWIGFNFIESGLKIFTVRLPLHTTSFNL